MSYNALRKGRASITGCAYLITTVTFRRQRLFLDAALARIVVRTLAAQDASGRTQTMAFVVMPDHLHWLFVLAGPAHLTDVVRRVKGVTAHAVNQTRGGSGRVWQPSFHDHAVRSEEDLRALARYVVCNPLRAGLVKNLREYTWWDAMWITHRA